MKKQSLFLLVCISILFYQTADARSHFGPFKKLFSRKAHSKYEPTPEFDVSPYFAASQDSGGIFGTELTFTNQDILKDSAENRDKQGYRIPLRSTKIYRKPGKIMKFSNMYYSPILKEKQKQWLELMDRRCRANLQCSVDKKKRRIQYSDGWYYQVELDEGVLEITSKPLTAEGHERNEARVQRDIFDLARENLGISPHKSAGGGHLHIDLESNFVDQKGAISSALLRNFVVDLMNHSEIFLGPLGNGVSNSPISVEGQKTIDKMAQLLKNTDPFLCSSRETSNKKALNQIRKFATEIMTKVYGDAFLPSRKDLSFKAHAINLCGLKTVTLGSFLRSFASNSCSIPTVELRAFRPQQNAKEITLEVKMLQNRIRYLRNSYGNHAIDYNKKSLFTYEDYEKELEKQNEERMKKGQNAQLQANLFQGLLDRDAVSSTFFKYITESGGSWETYKNHFIKNNVSYVALKRSKDPIDQYKELVMSNLYKIYTHVPYQRKPSWADYQSRITERKPFMRDVEFSPESSDHKGLLESIRELEELYQPELIHLQSLDHYSRYIAMLGLDTLMKARNMKLEGQIDPIQFLTQNQIYLMKAHLSPSFISKHNWVLPESEWKPKAPDTKWTEAETSFDGANRIPQREFPFQTVKSKLNAKMKKEAQTVASEKPKVTKSMFDSFFLTHFYRYSKDNPSILIGKGGVNMKWDIFEKNLRKQFGLEPDSKLIDSFMFNQGLKSQIKTWEEKYNAQIAQRSDLTEEEKYQILFALEVIAKASRVGEIDVYKYLLNSQKRLLERLYGANYLDFIAAHWNQKGSQQS